MIIAPKGRNVLEAKEPKWAWFDKLKVDRESKEFLEGLTAYRNEKTRSQNPHVGFLPQAMNWNAGWSEGQKVHCLDEIDRIDRARTCADDSHN